MTVKMSSEGDSAKSVLSEVNEKSCTDQTDSSQDSQDVKVEKNDKQIENNVDLKTEEEKKMGDSADDSQNSEKKEEKEEKLENDKPKNDVNDKDKENNKKDVKGEEKSDESEKEEEEDEEDDEEEEDKEKESKEVTAKKKPEKKPKDEEESQNDIKFENGSGTALGGIPRIDASISRFKNDDLKILHRILYDTVGKTNLFKKNIKKFNGFTFKKGSDEYEAKLALADEFELKQLKSVCEMLELQKTGSKDDIIDRILGFLIEPKDNAAKPVGGRPKRTAAVKANNRGYSSHDDYSSDEKNSPRGRRDKGKRPNLKDDTSSESDEDFHPSDESEEKPRPIKRRGRKKAVSEEELSDASDAFTDESDDEPKSKKKRTPKANNKSKGRGTGRRGRPPGSGKKGPGRKAKKPKDSTDEEEEESDKHDSSSEDEPLAKKAKGKEPPTDDEIKAYIKKILEGANLEEITMKNVCQKVYAHYPDFDLAHKKDFIKTTVKSLIST
ncbi:unnamed protein product [Brassicogethes aeneus]|uniref:Protein DEK n=1 Tax=Brassicogethes aeneus TaxID=1431903 RepID=A0A9P0AZ14_BRAAE|nr:unnamed protein product [Brassicogethes aeneus]